MINIHNYKKLCNHCYSILSLDSSSISRMSIPWLHIIRKHPEGDKRYNNIFFIENSLKINFLKFSSIIKQKLLNYFFLLKSILVKNEYWKGPKLNKNEIDFLFVSHALNKEQLKNNNDFYFGNIPNELKKQGYQVMEIQICHFFDNVFYKGDEIKKNFFSNLLSFSNELKIYNLMIGESNLLMNIKKKEKNIILKRLFKRASFEAMSIGTRNNLRLYFQMKQLMSVIKPKSVITTFEGHANEKIIFSSAREIHKKIKCIGYQHTGSFQSSNSIYRMYDYKYNPDYIFTSGNMDFKLFLNKLNNLKNIEVKVLGSSRGNFKKNNLYSKVKPEYNCLVIPEGFFLEVYKLFSFSLKCALKYPKINFIWRLHPSIGFDEIFKKAPELKNIPQNVILSNLQLEQDINNSKWCLYRGSTAVFKSISAGLRPIYLNNNEDSSIDPLFDMKKKNLNSIDDFIDLINFDISDNFKNLNKNSKIYKTFCNQRFADIDVRVFDEIF
jgi:hypothetical protein